MSWKISDILALLVTLFVSLNILISVISLSGKHLERRMDMEHLSLFFKMVLVFSAFGMPVLAGVILYKFVFGERIYYEKVRVNDISKKGKKNKLKIKKAIKYENRNLLFRETCYILIKL